MKIQLLLGNWNLPSLSSKDYVTSSYFKYSWEGLKKIPLMASVFQDGTSGIWGPLGESVLCVCYCRFALTSTSHQSVCRRMMKTLHRAVQAHEGAEWPLAAVPRTEWACWPGTGLARKTFTVSSLLRSFLLQSTAGDCGGNVAIFIHVYIADFCAIFAMEETGGYRASFPSDAMRSQILWSRCRPVKSIQLYGPCLHVDLKPDNFYTLAQYTCMILVK